MAGLAASPSLDQKAVLDNGAIVYTANVPTTNVFYLQLFLAIPRNLEGADLRHFMEHLIAKGQNKDLDAKLEARGITLTAETLHDGVRFGMEGPSEAVSAAVSALSELLVAPRLVSEEIEKEAKIMAQEEIVRPWSARLIAKLWESAFGTDGRDPFGSLESVRSQDLQALQATFESLMSNCTVSVSVVGDISERPVFEMVSNVVGARAKPADIDAPRVPLEVSIEQSVPDAKGRARGVACESLGKKNTLASLAAAFGLAAEVPGASIAYTPGPRGGVVAIIHPNRSGLDRVDTLIDAYSDQIATNGQATLLDWIDGLEKSPRERARTYSQTLPGESFFRIEDVRLRASRMESADIVSALDEFRAGKCYSAAGGGK